MAINVSQAFHRTSANPIDDTLALTKAEMLTVNDNLMPAKYITICQDDGQIYLYDKTNTADPTTGKFRVFEGGGGGSDIQVDTLPTASIDELGNIYQYVGVSDANYTNGCFYECVSDGEATPTYSWEMKPTMPSLSSGGIDEIVNPLPTGGRVTGFTPIGTIIPMIAETAPLYYLKCDGATYNKSDYPELAAHLLSMTNHSMYEVSGDDTKFKVPDLSGEFLRGTGANSHTNPYLSLNEGSGLDVGVHQPASVMPGITQYGGKLYYGYDETDNVTSAYEVYSTKNKYQYIAKDGAAGSQNDRVYMATTRPTNTSVLYCIATKDIYIDARNLYSTTEKVVGEWIDGSTLYQKTIDFGAMPNATDKYVNLNITNLNEIIGYRAVGINSIANAVMPIPYTSTNNLEGQVNLWFQNGQVRITTGNDRSGFSAYITIQYTKTT